MWLDGLYLAEPFYAEYAATFHHPDAFAAIGKQFALMDRQARDPKTGLLCHGWDESKAARLADPKTGLSSQFWARAIGWRLMALVDTLDYLPGGGARAELMAQLKRDAAAVERFQDAKSGLWFQVMDRGGQKGNYIESSASCMFVYALQKAVRRGYLPANYGSIAQHGYQGILSRFIHEGPGGDVTLTGTVRGAGLGGNPYRDGSHAYYVGEKVIANDPGNADIEHFNLLAEKFGVHYDNVLRNAVTGNNFEMGRLSLAWGGPVFNAPHTIYMKEICTIIPASPARALFVDHGDVLMATAKYGQGTVFATFDPWLYNEYTDGRKLPVNYDNFGAGKELARWLLEQIPSGSGTRPSQQTGYRH
jgi:hypothetical protein